MSDVLLLGLDGLSWSVVDQMEERGAVPNLSKVRHGSPTGTLKSTIPSLTCPALPALYTGQNPGEFGIFDFVKPDGSISNLTDIDVPKLWDYLDAAGRRSFIAGMRTTHPAPEIDGIFISGVLSPEDEPHYVTPDEYREEGRRFNEADFDIGALLDDDDREGIARAFTEKNRSDTDLLLDVLEREGDSLDLAFLWFSASDSAQHHLWHREDLLAEFFESFDRDVGRVLSFAEREGYDVLVVSDHGFGPAPKHYFHLNEWLYREGHLSIVGGRIGKPFVDLAYRVAERYTSDSLKRTAMGVVEAVRGVIGGSDADDDTGEKDESEPVVISPLDNLPGIDWEATAAHLSTRKVWGITIREDALDGEYEAVRGEIIDRLGDVEAPNGRPAIKGAWRGEELYHGRFGDQVPDIVILLDDEVRARPSVTGSLFSPARRVERTVGDHTSARDGVLAATGPSIHDGDRDLGAVEIYDVLPTLLHLLDVAVPERADGRVLTELFADGSSPAERPVRREAYEDRVDTVSGEYGQGEGVRRQLRDLGYL